MIKACTVCGNMDLVRFTLSYAHAGVTKCNDCGNSIVYLSPTIISNEYKQEPSQILEQLIEVSNAMDLVGVDYSKLKNTMADKQINE